MFSRGASSLLVGEKQYPTSVKRGRRACYLITSQTDLTQVVFIWAIHTHPQHHSLPAPKVSRAASFCTFWRFCFLYMYIIVRHLLSGAQYFTAILSHFLQLCGFVSFWKSLYCTFSEISGSKIRYTSSTHSLNLECSTIPRQVGCSWFFFLANATLLRDGQSVLANSAHTCWTIGAIVSRH